MFIYFPKFCLKISLNRQGKVRPFELKSRAWYTDWVKDNSKKDFSFIYSKASNHQKDHLLFEAFNDNDAQSSHCKTVSTLKSKYLKKAVIKYSR